MFCYILKNVENNLGGQRLTQRMETGIQRNRWIDGLTDQWTDRLNGLITIWQIDRQTDELNTEIDKDIQTKDG